MMRPTNRAAGERNGERTRPRVRGSAPRRTRTSVRCVRAVANQKNVAPEKMNVSNRAWRPRNADAGTDWRGRQSEHAGARALPMRNSWFLSHAAV